MVKNIYFDDETRHLCGDLDGIRLVFENGEVVGWYRPDGWEDLKNIDRDSVLCYGEEEV